MSRKTIAAKLSALCLAALATLALSAAAQSTPPAPRSGPQTINPGELWPDNRGQHIQAHGGGIIKYGGLYYWFGEQRGQESRPASARSRATHHPIWSIGHFEELSSR